MVPSLYCVHGEADDCLMLHIDDTVRSCYKKVIIASPETIIFAIALYHYKKWLYILIFKNCG